MSLGATRAAAVIPGLLAGLSVGVAAVSEAQAQALVQRKLVELRGTELVPSATFRDVSAAWRELLAGTSDDLSACGETTLDGFATELLAALIPDQNAQSLHKSLRARGVAAFGMLAAA
jgi:hypothetical protein